MNRPASLHAADLHGLSRLAVDGVLGTTELVEQMHYAIARVSGPTLPSKNGRTRGITGLVYRSIHGITGLVGGTTDLAFRHIVPRLAPAQSTPQRDRALAVLNGVLGDHLESSANPLALNMSLRFGGQPLLPDPARLAALLPKSRPKIAIFLHGLCMSDHHWTPNADASDQQADLPRLLEQAAGYLPLHLVYNSGRPIARNGREFAELLEGLVRTWPEPIDDLVLIGHSMGGLVAHSACHYGQLAGHAWTDLTRRLITLASPYQGAQLERIGHQVDRALALTPFTAPFTRLGGIRSAGITDLRHGRFVDPDWHSDGRCARSSAHSTGRDHEMQLPPHLGIYRLAASLSREPERWPARLLGDGLVTPDSALDHRALGASSLGPAPNERAIIRGVGHLQLLTHPETSQTVLGWIQ